MSDYSKTSKLPRNETIVHTIGGATAHYVKVSMQSHLFPETGEAAQTSVDGSNNI